MPPVPDFVLQDPSITVKEYSWERLSAATGQLDDGLWLVGINRRHGALRRRFSLMHEWYHILRLEGLSFSLDDTAPGSEEEQAANYFAASILMPDHWVFYYHAAYKGDLRRLCWRFRVSTAAMEVRLKELGLDTHQ